MFRIRSAEPLGPTITRFVIEAPLVARKWRAGQFVIVRVAEGGERIPLTVVETGPQGAITLIVQAVGKTTRQLCTLHAGDALLDVLGPLGHPTPVHRHGRVACVGGGVGTAELLPPSFRQPRTVLDLELARLRSAGVETRTNVLIGRTMTLDELMDEEGFSAVFLATGAGTPLFLGIPGENLAGVYSANEFLTRVNLMQAHRFPEHDTPVRLGREVAVVGGGNTALDAVRTARRLGAQRALLIYRRSREEMPARAEELAHAEEEGIELLLQTNPTRILGTPEGAVCGIECQSMAMGEADTSGRRRPVPVPGSERVVAVQTVIVAVGQRPNPIVQSTTSGLDTGPHGVVTVDEAQRTSRPGVFAGGDLSRGGATVILAMRDGRRAAAAIHEHLAR